VKQIRRPGKGGKLVTVPITPGIREILEPLQGHHPKRVFTFKAQYTRDGRVRGERYPLNLPALKAAWQRLRKRSGVEGFRFHDYRHDFATKLLRKTGNLRLVQKALNHSDYKSTLRYSHVRDEEVADAMEQVEKSRARSRNKLREVS
jgi:integrase